MFFSPSPNFSSTIKWGANICKLWVKFNPTQTPGLRKRGCNREITVWTHFQPTLNQMSWLCISTVKPQIVHETTGNVSKRGSPRRCPLLCHQLGRGHYDKRRGHYVLWSLALPRDDACSKVIKPRTVALQYGENWGETGRNRQFVWGVDVRRMNINELRMGLMLRLLHLHLCVFSLLFLSVGKYNCRR